jgi:uncharacterized protein YceK
MKRIVLSLTVAALLSGCMVLRRPPSDPMSYQPTQTSAAQLYRATFSPAESIRVRKLHRWNIQVVTCHSCTRGRSPR